MSLKKRIIKNSFATIVAKLSTILNHLILVPFFLKNWGADLYGEWITITIIPTILAFADFGFGSAASSSMVLAFADKRKKEFADMAATGFRAVSLIIVIVIIFSFGLLQLLDYLNTFDKLIISSQQAFYAIFFLMIARSVGFYQQFFEGYYRAAQKAHLSIYLTSFNSIFTILGSILVLQLGGGVVHLALTPLIITILFVPTYSLIARGILPVHREEKGKLSIVFLKDFFKTGLGYLLQPMWQVLLLQGTTFIVRIILGPAPVALYSTVRTVANIITQVVSMIQGSTFPDLQFEIGAKRLQNAQRIFVSVLGLSALIGTFSSLFLIFFGPWFYRLWTANELNPPSLMWILFMSSVFFKAIWWGAGIVFRAHNKPYLFNIPCLLSAMLSVITSYTFISFIGISGVAVGILLMDVILVFLLIPKIFLIMKLNYWDFYIIIKLYFINKIAKGFKASSKIL